jgi:tetratricopeptide (TPR) repeat protein
MGNLEEALEQWRKLLEAYPNNPEAYVNLAELHLRADNPRAALNRYEEGEQLLEQVPEWEELQAHAGLVKGLIMLKQNKPKPALEAWAQAQAIDPNVALSNAALLKSVVQKQELEQLKASAQALGESAEEVLGAVVSVVEGPQEA